MHSEQNHQMFYSRGYSASCSGSTRNLALPESDYQNLEFIADGETISNDAFFKKITAHENYVALSNHFLSIINQKRIVMLNKINRANGIYGSTPCSSGFIRHAVSSKCRGAGKS
jgi:hypothetical protein